MFGSVGRTVARLRAKTLRGRVFRVAIIRGGEVSVTLRFGIEELEAAKQLQPGALLELFQVTPAPKPRRALPKSPPPPPADPDGGGPMSQEGEAERLQRIALEAAKAVE